jgi:hypothetical protein
LLRYKMLLEIDSIPAHVWSVDNVQAILGSSCVVAEPSPRLVRKDDMSSFLVAAWAVHRELISEEVGCVVPKPEEPFIERVPPLFLSSSEIVHSKRGTL